MYNTKDLYFKFFYDLFYFFFPITMICNIIFYCLINKNYPNNWQWFKDWQEVQSAWYTLGLWNMSLWAQNIYKSFYEINDPIERIYPLLRKNKHLILFLDQYLIP